MTPLPFVLPYALIFWAIFAWAFWPEFQIVRRAGKSVRRADSPDAGSYRVIVNAMGIAFLVAWPLAWVPALRFPQQWELTAFIVGLVFVTAGSLLRRHPGQWPGARGAADHHLRRLHPPAPSILHGRNRHECRRRVGVGKLGEHGAAGGRLPRGLQLPHRGRGAGPAEGGGGAVSRVHAHPKAAHSLHLLAREPSACRCGSRGGILWRG